MFLSKETQTDGDGDDLVNTATDTDQSETNEIDHHHLHLFEFPCLKIILHFLTHLFHFLLSDPIPNYPLLSLFSGLFPPILRYLYPGHYLNELNHHHLLV